GVDDGHRHPSELGGDEGRGEPEERGQLRADVGEAHRYRMPRMQKGFQKLRMAQSMQVSSRRLIMRSASVAASRMRINYCWRAIQVLYTRSNAKHFSVSDDGIRIFL